ncbi:MAG TPA: nuclear transport factor 2 family protein [Acidimicrobiales bacterium]|nr:nuclear transport factor 2 family protein [Acidimicrobiales bacterium]
MTTTETTPIPTIIDTYFAMWNEADRDARLDLIARAWAPECHYVDPLSDVEGHEALADMVDGVRAQFPGATLQRTGDIDTHHNVLRFPWNAVGPDGTVIVEGIDVGMLADDGRLQAIAGFFG